MIEDVALFTARAFVAAGLGFLFLMWGYILTERNLRQIKAAWQDTRPKIPDEPDLRLYYNGRWSHR